MENTISVQDIKKLKALKENSYLELYNKLGFVKLIAGYPIITED